MKKIIFFQPGYAQYRDQFFEILSKRHQIHFIYERTHSNYPGKVVPKNIQYTFIDNKFKVLWIGLIFYLLKYKPGIVISSNSTSTSTMISFLYCIIFRQKMILCIEEWRKPFFQGLSLRSILGSIRYLIGATIIVKSHALITAGTASYNYALSLGKKKGIFMNIQSSNDLRLHRSKALQNHTNKKFKYIFLYMSRIIPLKGLDILIRAFTLLRKERSDISLLIAGDGPFKNYCFDLCALLKTPDIKFIGSIATQITWKIYAKADVFILPSYFIGNSYEGWGLVINEAMSMGLPIITTNAVGAAYDMVIDGYNGLMVKENSVDNLYRAMKQILEFDLKKTGLNSRKLFDEKNDFEKMADSLTNAINYLKTPK